MKTVRKKIIDGMAQAIEYLNYNPGTIENYFVEDFKDVLITRSSINVATRICLDIEKNNKRQIDEIFREYRNYALSFQKTRENEKRLTAANFGHLIVLGLGNTNVGVFRVFGGSPLDFSNYAGKSYDSASLESILERRLLKRYPLVSDGLTSSPP